MTEFAAKEQTLKSAGYSYSFDRELYVNRRLKRAFSVQFIEDHSNGEIAQLAEDKSSSLEWQFFFNTKPSAAVEQQLASVLG